MTVHIQASFVFHIIPFLSLSEIQNCIITDLLKFPGPGFEGCSDPLVHHHFCLNIGFINTKYNYKIEQRKCSREITTQKKKVTYTCFKCQFCVLQNQISHVGFSCSASNSLGTSLLYVIGYQQLFQHVHSINSLVT